MKEQRKSSSSFDFRTIVLVPIIPILIVLLLVITLASGFLQGRLQNGWVNMTEFSSVEILRTDAETSERYDSLSFPVLNRGDALTVRVDLPAEHTVKDAVLGLNVPHVAGIARYGDEVLWSYGQDRLAQDKFIGNLFFRVPLRDEMWGGHIELEFIVAENDAFSTIPDIYAVPSINSVRFFLAQFNMDLIFFLAFFIIYTIACFVFLFYRRGKNLRWEGLFLSAFCTLLGFWFLAGHGFFYTLSDQIQSCAHLEYVAIFLLPIPFCLFMFVHMKQSRFCRVFSAVMTCIFILLFAIATVLNYTTQYHYLSFLMLLQILMLGGLACFVLMLIFNKYTENLSRMIIRWGVAISMLILMLEVGRYNLVKFFLEDSVLGNLSFVSTGMLVFAGALSIGYVARLADAIGSESDKAILRRIAYIDVLTGISNRTYCSQKIEELEAAGEKHFALMFFDLNGLKWVNDNFGHDMGDQFIHSVAQVLQKVFGEQQFCGRWGGDEFISCLTGENVRYAEALLRSFDHELSLLNDSRQFPFHIAVAYGMVRSTEQEGLSMKEAIKEADRRMYTTKIRMYDEDPSLPMDL